MLDPRCEYTETSYLQRGCFYVWRRWVVSYIPETGNSGDHVLGHCGAACVEHCISDTMEAGAAFALFGLWERADQLSQCSCRCREDGDSAQAQSVICHSAICAFAGLSVRCWLSAVKRKAIAWRRFERFFLYHRGVYGWKHTRSATKRQDKALKRSQKKSTTQKVDIKEKIIW